MRAKGLIWAAAESFAPSLAWCPGPGQFETCFAGRVAVLAEHEFQWQRIKHAHATRHDCDAIVDEVHFAALRRTVKEAAGTKTAKGRSRTLFTSGVGNNCAGTLENYLKAPQRFGASKRPIQSALGVARPRAAWSSIWIA